MPFDASLLEPVGFDPKLLEPVEEPDPVEEKIAALKAGLTESQAAAKSATRKANAYQFAENLVDLPRAIKTAVNVPYHLAGGKGDMPPLVSPEQVKMAREFLANPTGGAAQLPDQTPSPVDEAVERGLDTTVSGLSSPENVALALLAKKFPTGVSAYFEGQTLGAIPESTQRVLESKSLPEAAEALVPAVANVAGSAVLGRHLAGPMALPKLSPLLDALTGELTDEQIAQLRGNGTRLEDLNVSLPESQLTSRTGPNPIIRVPAAPPLNGNGVAVQPPPAPPVVKPTPSVLDVADGPKVELPPAKGPSPRALPKVGETVQFEGEGDAVQSGKVVDLRVDEDQQVTPIVQTKDGLVALPDWQSGERLNPVKVEGTKAEPIAAKPEPREDLYKPAELAKPQPQEPAKVEPDPLRPDATEPTIKESLTVDATPKPEPAKVGEDIPADLASAGAPKGGSEFLPESKPASESVKPAMFYATSDLTGPVEVVRDFVGSPNVWEVRLKDGTLMEVESFRMKRLISGFDDKLIASAKQRTQPVKPTGELFAPKEMPFNLTGETVKPAEAKTGFGNEQEMFAIQKITELKDPAKSADAAQQIHGSPDAAAKALQRQLAVVDSDPVTKKAFAKEQRQRLQAVIQLLQQRADPKIMVEDIGGGQFRATRQTATGRQSLEGRKDVIEKMVQQWKQPSKWTSATDEGALGGQMLMGIPDPIRTYKAAVALTKAGIKALTPAARASAEAIRQVAHEVINSGKMTDYRRSVLNWSAKLQRSFGEASEAQRDIMKRVPNESRRAGITNWIQANGDAAVLTARRDATTNPKLRAGYDAALTLTPEETAVAQEVRGAYNALGLRGEHYDVLKSFKDNYVTQIWNLGKSPGAGGGGSRTLKERFKFSRASTFPTFFDGEQAGFVPKTKDIAKLLPVYLHEMNSVIAARQLVQEMSKGVASDGRPLVAARGTGIPVNDATGKATLVMPKVPKGDTGDYKTLENQPALHDWRWAAKDDAGNPIFLKADLALHPEAYNRIKAVLGKSAIREWYNTPTSATAAIPKAMVKGIDMAQSETKRTMLGLFAPFHQVQEGFHGIGHRVNPLWNIPKIDLVNDGHQMDAARHGLMLLPDRASEGQFMEGFKASGLVSKIPIVGPMADFYSHYLFHEYIPGLKYKTYQAILERNQKVFAGKLKPEEVKALSAEQANAAYGHLNYADLGRNPTMQHLAQLGLLAPDFLEARGRFAGQALRGATGAKVGREQIVALATLAVAQATLAWIGAKTTGGDWDHKRPFEFRNGTRKYTMRSVPEDIYGLTTQTRQFVNSRLAPLTQSLEQFRSGVDWRGQKVTAGETAKEMLAKPIPLTVRELPGLRHLTGSDRPGNVTPLEQLAGALGLRISRANPREDLNTQHAEWLKNNKDPRVRADYERNAKATYPTSKYKEVDSRLGDGNDKAAMEALQALRQQEGGNEAADNRIFKRFQKASVGPVFHESWAHENAFKATLTPEQVKLYDAAKQEKQATFKKFQDLWARRARK